MAASLRKPAARYAAANTSSPRCQRPAASRAWIRDIIMRCVTPSAAAGRGSNADAEQSTSRKTSPASRAFKASISERHGGNDAS